MNEISGKVSEFSAVDVRRFRQRRRALHRESMALFESMVATGILTSNTNDRPMWDDIVWVYRSRKLWFCELRGMNEQVLRGSMFRIPGNIRAVDAGMAMWMKSFIVHCIKKNSRFAPTHIARYLQPMRWLSDYVNGNVDALVRLDQRTLERLVEHIDSEGDYRSNTLYQLGRELAAILNWMSRQRLLARTLTFRNPLVDPIKARMDVTTQAFADHRAKKFPNHTFVDAVTAIKRKLTADPTLERKPGYDWIRVYTIPFMLAMGLRLGEVVTLPLDALYDEEASGKLYLRVWTEKGQTPMLRYVPKIWAPAIRESFRALVELCRPARTLAKDIETGAGFSFIEERLLNQERDPKDVERLSECGFDTDEYFYTRELLIIGFTHRHFIHRNGGILRELLEETGYPGKKWQKVVSITRLRGWFEARFNKYLSLHYHENILDQRSGEIVKVDSSISSSAFRQHQPLHKHLIVVFDGQFDGNKDNVTLLPMPMLQRHLQAYLASGGKKLSVFERLDIRDSNGKVFKVSPHQFRHWVTTSLQREGAHDMAIDRWMGREIGQNRCYDHRTGKERAEAIREKYLQRDSVPNDYLGKKVKRLRLCDVDDAVVRHTVTDFIRVAHFTPWGFCSRDLAVVPCNRSLLCLKGFDGDSPCRHFHLDPLDHQARENIERLLRQYEHQLKVLVPEYDHDDFSKTLNLTETLDQHIHHAVQIVAGCKAALRAFESNDQGTLVSARSAYDELAAEA